MAQGEKELDAHFAETENSLRPNKHGPLRIGIGIFFPDTENAYIAMQLQDPEPHTHTPHRSLKREEIQLRQQISRN